MPFPCPHCATPQEDDNSSCEHCGLAFGPGTDRLGGAATEANGESTNQVTSFQELLAAVAARGSEVDPRAIPPPAPTVDFSKPDPSELPQQGQQYPPSGQYPGQGYPPQGQIYPPQGQYYTPQQFIGQAIPGQPYNITLHPNGGQGINITQYPQFSGMNATIMPVAVPVRQGLSVWATLLLAAIFGSLVAMVVFLLLHANTVSQGPNVKISEPTSGTIIAAGQSVDISVEATDTTGHLTNVDFYYQASNQERQFIKTVLVPPYSVEWTPKSTGDYSIVAVATDDHQTTATSRVSVQVNGTMPNLPAAPATAPQPVHMAAPRPPAHPAGATGPNGRPSAASGMAPVARTAAMISPIPIAPPRRSPSKPTGAAASPSTHISTPVASWSSNADSVRRMREARERGAKIRQAQIAHASPKPVVHASAPQSRSSKSYHITTLVSPNRSNADILAAALRKRGYNVHTQRVGGGWAVQSPTYHSKSDAASAAKQLEKSGYNAGISN